MLCSSGPDVQTPTGEDALGTPPGLEASYRPCSGDLLHRVECIKWLPIRASHRETGGEFALLLESSGGGIREPRIAVSQSRNGSLRHPA